MQRRSGAHQITTNDPRRQPNRLTKLLSPFLRTLRRCFHSELLTNLAGLFSFQGNRSLAKKADMIPSSSTVFGFGLHRRRGVGAQLAALVFLLAIFSAPPTAAQPRHFFWVTTSVGTTLYTSQDYATRTEATAAMYAYWRGRFPTVGNRLSYWFSSGNEQQLFIYYRVRPELPRYWIIRGVPNNSGTPEEACATWGGAGGELDFQQATLMPTSTGSGQYQCSWIYTGPMHPSEVGCVGNPCIYWQYILPECEKQSLGSVPNENPAGELMCGFSVYATVVTQDQTPDKPEECPIEGNPVHPPSQQKLQTEADYANAEILSFVRTYASQRDTVKEVGSSWSHTYSAALGPRGGPSSVTLSNGTRASIYAESLDNSIRSITADMPFSGSFTYQAGNFEFTLLSPFEATVEHYDSDGRLRLRTYANGRSQRLSYTNGRRGYLPGSPLCILPASYSTYQPPVGAVALRCVTDELGRQLNFITDSAGRILKLIDPAGGVIDYQYDGATSVVQGARPPVGNLTQATFPDGFIRVYHYNEPSLTQGADLPSALTGISDTNPVGVVARLGTYGYDASGRAISTELAGGVLRNQVTYSADLSTINVTRPLGNVTHSYQKVVGAMRRTATLQPPGSGSPACSDARKHDARGNVVARTDFNGNTTCFAYSSRNLELRRIEGVVGGAELCAAALSSPPAGSRVISTEWHPDWPLKTRIAEPKKITTLIYNGQGTTCTSAPNLSNGKVPAVLCIRSEQATIDDGGALGFAAGGEGLARTWQYSYGAYGRVLAATDPNGHQAFFTYFPDDDPDLGRRGQLATTTNAAGHVTRITAYNLHSQPTRIVDPNGLVTELAYDARMRLLSQRMGSEVTRFTYMPDGSLATTESPDGTRLTYAYDAARRLTGMRDQSGNRIEYVLDAAGNRVAENTFDADGVLTGKLERLFDALSRVQRLTGIDR